MKTRTGSWLAATFVAALLSQALWTSAAEPPKSAKKLLSSAYQSGEISKETYLVESIKAVFFPSKVDKRFASAVKASPGERIDLTLILDEAQKGYDSFSAESKAAIDAALTRPDVAPTTTDEAKLADIPLADRPDTTSYFVFGKVFYLPAPVLTLDSGKFTFHYVTHNTADAGGNVHQTTAAYVNKAANYMNKVYDYEVTTAGFAAPPDDPGGAAYGGSTKFDIYIMDTDKVDCYGYCSREGVSSGQKYYSFMAIDNDFTEGSTADQPADQMLVVTLGHEYNHAIQNGYNGLATTWYKECSSTWMGWQTSMNVYGKPYDYYRWRAGEFFKAFWTPIDKNSDTFWYYSWVFNAFVTSKGGNNAVRDIWAKIAAPVDNPITSIEAYFVGKGGTLRSAFEDFSIQNYTKEGYSDGEYYAKNFPLKPYNDAAPHKLDYSSAASSKIDWQSFNTVSHLATNWYFKFVPGDTLKEPTTLTVSFDGCGAANEVTAVVIAKKKDGKFASYKFVVDANNKGQVGVSDFSVNTISEVVIGIVNYSKTVDAISFKYKAELESGFVFAIDDTGSMSSAIAGAKAGAFAVLDANATAGVKPLYTLFSFKDGSPTYRGQSDDVATMKSFISALSADGGNGTPESSLTTLRHAAEFCKNSDIMLMTDAPSNSYGVDDTYATFGEVLETIYTLQANNARAHIIYFGGGSSSPGMVRDNMGNMAPAPQAPAASAYITTSQGYSQVSSKTGGLYFNTVVASTTACTTMIVDSTSVNNTIAYFTGTKPAAYTIPADSTVTQLQISLNGASSSSLTLEVRNPTGAVMTSSTSGVTVVTADKSVLYVIGKGAVAAGNWTATVSGTGSFTIKGDAATTNTMSYTGATSVGINNLLTMNAGFDAAVTGLTFDLVAVDNSATTPVTLFSTDNLSYTGSQKMTTAGQFLFRAKADASAFQRMCAGIITVNNISIAADAASKSVAPGSTATSAFTIKNLGATSLSLDLYSNTIQKWATLTGIPSSVTLTAGESKTYTVPVAVPSTASTGTTDTISLQAVSSADTSVAASATAGIVASTSATLYKLTVSGGTGSGNYEAGASVDIAYSGTYYFSQWTTLDGDTSCIASATLASTKVTMPAKDVVVIANYIVNPVTLTIACQPTGAATLSPDVGAHVVEKSSSVPLSATVASGYLFIKWVPSDSLTIDSPRETSANVTVPADGTVTAQLAANTSVAEKSVKFTSKYAESIVKKTLKETDKFTINLKTPLPEGFDLKSITDDTPVIIMFGGWSLDKTIADAEAKGKKVTEKGGSVKYLVGGAKDSPTTTKIGLTWNKKTMTMSITSASVEGVNVMTDPSPGVDAKKLTGSVSTFLVVFDGIAWVSDYSIPWKGKRATSKKGLVTWGVAGGN